MSKGSNLIKNTLILGLGTISSQFIGFFLLPLYTHYLSPTEFGYVDVATVYLSLLVPSITLQLNMASFRFLVSARGNPEEQTKVISNIVTMVVTLALPWIILVVVLGFFIQIEYLYFILMTGVAMLCSQQALQMTRGIGSNKQYAIASIITGLTSLLGAVIFIVWLGLRVEGMLLSLSSAYAVSAFYLIVRMRLYRYVKAGMKDKALRQEFFGYSVPLIPNGLAWWANNAADRVLVTLMINTAANGIYAVSTKFSSILNGLFGVFSMSWTESATLHIDEPDRDEFFSRVANSVLRLFGAMGLGLISAMPFIFPVMVNSEFNSAMQYIPLMVAGVFFNALVGIYSAIYIAKKLTMKVMNTSIIAAIINIVLTLLLMPIIGLFGAASATVFTFLIMAIIRHYDVRKFVKITYEKRTFLILAILYVLVSIIYYVGDLWMQITGLMITTLAAYLINRSQLGAILSVLGKRRTKTA